MKLFARELSYHYGRKPVLDGVSIEVPEGMLLGLVGPNGAGKSTLMRCLYGSLHPTAGEVRLEGRSIRHVPRREIARTIGVVPQRCEPVFPVSVRHFVGMGRFAREPLLGGPSRGDDDAVEGCLVEMGLTGVMELSAMAWWGVGLWRVMNLSKTQRAGLLKAPLPLGVR